MSDTIKRNQLYSWMQFISSLFWPFLLFCSWVLVFCGWVAYYGFQPGPLLDKDSVVVQIPKGATVQQIGELLAGAGLVHKDFRFVLVTRAMGVGGRLPAGEFALASGKSPIELLNGLTKARPLQHIITIPEGLRASEIAEIFARDGWCDRNRFVDLVHNPSFIQSLKIREAASLEGYLYPDTYYLVRGNHTEEKLIRMMVLRFHKIYEQLAAEYHGSQSRHELVTLASMVEKETGDPRERATIAAVFFNRLRRTMRLQSDPTVIYGLDNFSGNLTRKDLKTPSPYNTYVIPALPVGPICNPGGEAIRAVLHPAEEKYLYFVSKNNGSHYFSKSLQEHNRAVYKYQKKRGAGKKAIKTKLDKPESTK